MKDPVLRFKLGQSVGNPSGNVLEEIAQQDMIAVGGAMAMAGLSTYLGNKGRFCTLTVECMPSCQPSQPKLPTE